MKVAFAEQTMDMDLGHHTIRIWRATNEVMAWSADSNRPSIGQLCDQLSDPGRIASMQDIRDIAYDMLAVDDPDVNPNVAAFLERVTKMPGVTAVQVIRKSSGDGIVIYTEWP